MLKKKKKEEEEEEEGAMSMGNLCYQILHVSSSNRATYPVPLL